MAVVDELKQRIDLVELVSQYVELQRSGRGYKALCPFHHEKTPSFYVFPETQSWRCFGACATGGDAFGFLMRKENLSFPEALRRLAARTGIMVPEGRQGTAGSHSERLRSALEEALHFFQRLLSTSPEAQETRRYLEQRGVTYESVESFELGYSLKDWDALKSHLTMKGYPPEEMAAAGLLVSSEDGILRDRFRHRLMFPIRDAQGRLVGFGARALTVQDHPKYLNSPQTDLFDKGSLLYGIHRAATAIREQSQAVIVEGYMDVIIAHQHGFSNTVASMGTALTERQVSQLRRLASRVILALDADAAGAEATLRSLEDAWDVFRRRPRDDHNAGIGARAVPDTILSVLTMPSGKDPDEVILESPQEWERLLSTALPLLDYLLEALAQRVDLATDAGKTQALKLLMPLVLRLPDVSSQDRYTQKVAELVDVDQELLRRMLPELTRRTRKRQEHLLEQAVGTTPSGDPLEQYLIRLLYFYPDLMERVQEVLEPSHFLHTEHWELLQALVHWEQMQESGQELDTTLQEYLQALVARPLPAIKPRDRQKAVQDCITRLEERRIRLLKAQEEQRFLDKSKALESSEEVEHLYQQAVELNQRLRQVLVQRES